MGEAEKFVHGRCSNGRNGCGARSGRWQYGSNGCAYCCMTCSGTCLHRLQPPSTADLAGCAALKTSSAIQRTMANSIPALRCHSFWLGVQRTPHPNKPLSAGGCSFSFPKACALLLVLVVAGILVAAAALLRLGPAHVMKQRLAQVELAASQPDQRMPPANSSHSTAAQAQTGCKDSGSVTAAARAGHT